MTADPPVGMAAGMGLMLNRFYRSTKADFLCLGVNALVPAAVTVLLLLTFGLLASHQSLDMRVCIRVLEAVCCPAVAWYSIFLLQPMLQEKGGEIFYTYPVSRSYYGSVRIIRIYAIHVLFLVCSFLLFGLRLQTGLWSLWFQLSAEGLLFLALGFLAMTLTADAHYALAIVICYALACQFLPGYIPPDLNVFVQNENLIPIQEYSSQLLLPKVILMLILWITAQNVFSARRAFAD